MSSTLDVQAEPSTDERTLPSRRLRAATTAMRLAFVWFGTRKTLTVQQKAQAAAPFSAEGEFLSVGKKLIDTRHPAFKAVTAVRSRAASYWRGVSLPFPEPGIRLIRQDDIVHVNQLMSTLKAELDEAVQYLDEQFGELKAVASERLGSLYNPADYPVSLQGLFDISWDFPSVEPPAYLKQLSPQVYEQECQRVAARFDEAIQLAEQAFVEQLSDLVSHLCDKLSGIQDGKSKIFRDSAVENVTAFFDRFRRLSITSSSELDELVERDQAAVRGVAPQQLRDNSGLRQHVTSQLASVQSVLDGLMVERPRRRIMRPGREA